MTEKPTCGPLFLEAINRHAGDDPDKRHLFAAGFVHGQAEKVYLGACAGAMFRPSVEYAEEMYHLVESAATQYSLIGPIILGQELWLLRDTTALKAFHKMQGLEANSPNWHFCRGRLCGIPQQDIDIYFHERRGYGKPCDKPAYCD